MHTFRQLLLMTAILTTALLPLPARADDPPLLKSWTDLGLKLTATRLEPEIKSQVGIVKITLKPEAGHKLIVVTMTGELASPARISVNPRALIAQTAEGNLYLFSGVRIGSLWLIASTQMTVGRTIVTPKPGVLTVEAAFIFPDDEVEEFEVLIPSLVAGMATVK
jgi:hypothetical protein